MCSLLTLTNFEYLLEVECDVTGLGTGTILALFKWPTAYFSDKLKRSWLNYSTYDKEFYTIVKALKHYSHYLKLMAYVLYSDNKSPPFINR